MDMTPLATRKPTNLPPWPIGLLAGAQKSGKTYAAIAASASDLVGRTLVITIGEDDPDEYGAIPGADFDIVVHDGTYRGILHAIDAARAELAGDDKPGLLIIDSMSRLWDMLSDMAQDEANRRGKGRTNANGDRTISMDLWNLARSRWDNVMGVIREHQGPSLLTSRMSIVAVMDDRGQPTAEKDTKIGGHKTLPFDVGFIVQMSEPGKAELAGARTMRLDGRTERPALDATWTVEGIWRSLGLHETGTSNRQHTTLTSAVEETKPEPQPASESNGQPDTARRQSPPPAPTDFVDAMKSAETVTELRSRMAALTDRLAASMGADKAAAWGTAKSATVTFGDGLTMSIGDLYTKREASLTDRGRVQAAPQPEPAQAAAQPDDRRTEDVPVTDRERPYPEGEGWSRPSAEGAQRRATIDPDDPWATPAPQADTPPSSMEQAVSNVEKALGGTVLSDEHGPEHGTTRADQADQADRSEALTGEAARQAMAQARAAGGLPESGRDRRG